jgi:hypothetical protein
MVVSVNNSQIKVKFSVPDNNGSPIDLFQVCIINNDSESSKFIDYTKFFEIPFEQSKGLASLEFYLNFANLSEIDYKE